MEQLFNFFTAQLSFITTPTSDDDQSLTNSSPIEDFCDPFLAQLPWSSPTNSSDETHAESTIEASNINRLDKQLHIDAKRSTQIEEPQLESNQATFQILANEDENSDTHSDIGSFELRVSPPDPRYSSDVEQYRIRRQTPPDDQDSFDTDDDQSSTTSEYYDLLEEPTLTLDNVPSTSIEEASKAGKMPMMCLWCYRFEDQEVEKVEDRDMVPTKCFMIGNRVFFKKERPFWAQCGPCGYGRPAKEFRERKRVRLNKLFRKVTCKVTGRKYKETEKPRTGYEWYVKCFQKGGPYVDIDTWYANNY